MSRKPIRILLQTTIPTIEGDWSIAGFSLLAGHLASLKDAQGEPLCEVVARDRCAAPRADDPVLATLDASDVDQLWLFAVDPGNGLTAMRPPPRVTMRPPPRRRKAMRALKGSSNGESRSKEPVRIPKGGNLSDADWSKPH